MAYSSKDVVEILLLAVFLPLKENNCFAVNCLCFVDKRTLCGRPLYLPYCVRYNLLVYSGQHIFHQFRTTNFFCPYFPTLVATTFFHIFSRQHPSPGV